MSLDYNGAEVRTFLSLSGIEQPTGDIHDWNIKSVFKNNCNRDEAKVLFFSWLYNPESKMIEKEFYNREKVLDKWYRDGYIITPSKRKIQVNKKKALNFLIQSDTSDRVLKRAVELDKLLENSSSFVSHIVHDEVVIDFSEKDKNFVMQIKETFEKDNFKANIKAGRNYLDFKELNL